MEEEQQEPGDRTAASFPAPSGHYLSSPKEAVTSADNDTSLDEEEALAAVVTPRYRSSPTYFGDSDPETVPADIPLPQDLDGFSMYSKKDTKGGAGLRMVSPQPRSPPLVGFLPRTPTKSQILVPSLVSPSPGLGQKPKDLEDLSATPLPVLVDVACSALPASTLSM
jgi:hypothetical protein